MFYLLLGAATYIGIGIMICLVRVLCISIAGSARGKVSAGDFLSTSALIMLLWPVLLTIR